jgi:hypothetical protein
MPLEPTFSTPWKLSVIGFGSILFIFSYGAVFLAIAKSDYKPFKAKQPWVLVIALTACLIWWIGGMQTLGIIDQEGIFAICSMWGVWAQVFLLLI